MIQKILNYFSNTSIKSVINKQLDKNIKAVESLHDYDQGKKDISTLNIERNLPNIRVAP